MELEKIVIKAWLNQRPADVADGDDFESGSQLGADLELPEPVVR